MNNSVGRCKVKLSSAQCYLLIAMHRGYYVRADGSAVAPSGKVLARNPSRDGYARINVRVDGVNRQVYVHRLAALQKFGAYQLFAAGVEVRHLDGTKDNRFLNIGIGTSADNKADMSSESRESRLSAVRKLTREQVFAIRSKHADTGCTQRSIAKEYNVSNMTISSLLSGASYAQPGWAISP